MFRTKVKAAAAACVVLVTGGVVLAQAATPAEATKQPPKKNILYVATDGSGDYNTDGTDDHVELNQAFLDIHKKGGGTVHLKKGTYTVSDTLIIYENTVVEGDGWASVIKLRDKVDWPKYKWMINNHRKKGRRNITIRNLKIDGNCPSPRPDQHGHTLTNQLVRKGADYHLDTLGLSHISGLTLSGLSIVHTTNDGMKISACKNVTIENNNIYDDGHDDIYLSGGCENVKIINNTLAGHHNSGIRIASSNRIVVRGNSLRSRGAPSPGGAGIQIELQIPKLVMDDILIEQNRIFNFPGTGITMGNPYPSRFRSFRIRNNLIYGCGRGGISVRGGTDNVLIENNTIFNNLGASGICFRGTGGDKAIVRNNIIACNHGYGISAKDVRLKVKVLSSYNNIWGNTRGNYEGSVITEHDTSVEPLFVQAPLLKRGPDYKEGGWGFNLDLHLKSSAGRWDGKTWEKDRVDSPCIDGGSAKSVHDAETVPNGNRINMGAYGNTKEASKSAGIARGTISGRITDKDTKTPVSKATVSTKGYSGISDADGSYTIVDLPPGKYALTVSAPAYVDQGRDSIQVTKDSATQVDFTLEKEKESPVVASHFPAGENPVGRIIGVTFSEPMNADSVEKGFSVFPAVKGSFAWQGTTMYFIPDSHLNYETKYKVSVGGAEDLAGNRLRRPHVWEFNTLSRDKHLIGHWRFEEDSGDTAKDSSGRGNHGALKGNPARVEGKIGKALSFDGTDDCVAIPHGDGLKVHEEITVEAWVKIDEKIAPEAGIVSKYVMHGGSRTGYYFTTAAYPKNRRFRFECWIKAPKGKRTERARVLPDGKTVFGSWTFLAATRDFHGNVKAYIDGEEVGKAHVDRVGGPKKATIIAENPRPLLIGSGLLRARHFKGIIDEVRIYNRALTAAEIKADFGRTK